MNKEKLTSENTKNKYKINKVIYSNTSSPECDSKN
jgi:hypothetical protein